MKKYSIEEVHAQLRKDTKKIDFDGKKIKMNSQRYHLFKEKGCACVSCGLVGSYYKITESKEKGKVTGYHFNLYAVNNKGEEVLMTKDHILPKSKGGRNHISNYQPMCVNCNGKKGCQIELTSEQWNIIFDALSHRVCDLEEARENHPHAEEFLKEKIKQIDEIQTLIGPLSV